MTPHQEALIGEAMKRLAINEGHTPRHQRKVSVSMCKSDREERSAQIRRDILPFLHKPRCVREISAKLGMPETSVRYALQKLERQGAVVHFGHTRVSGQQAKCYLAAGAISKNIAKGVDAMQ